VERARRSHHITAVLFIDLDAFKSINDLYGHHVGDELLVAVAGRLTTLLRPGDALCRIGGDEFVALCEDMATAADAEAIAARITSALAEPFPLPSLTVTVSGSVGIAFSGPGQDMPVILRNADFAMYQAKNDGGGRYRVSDPNARLAADRRNHLDAELDLAYQPIVSLSTGHLAGVEALLRWNHPVQGLVMPTVVIPSAERTGMIIPLGEWVLQQACRDLVQWKRDGLAVPQLAVNVSARQVMGPSFAQTVAAVLNDTGADPTALCLEVTESLFLGDTERAAGVMNEIKDLGVQLSLDDFGTGYSSLTYLQSFPVDIVKIDRSFTARIAKSESTRSIVHAMIDLSHVLDMTVVAEGVETPDDLERITEMGADYGQGFHFSRPIPRNDFSDYAAANFA
jgi:diguanylate cyclase (GGDEF)-like protein